MKKFKVCLWTTLGLGLALIATAAPASAAENPTPQFTYKPFIIEQLLVPVGGDGGSVGDHKLEAETFDPYVYSSNVKTLLHYLSVDQNSNEN